MRTSVAAAFQSGSFSPKKAWNTVPDVYSVCSSSCTSNALKMSSVKPTGRCDEFV